MSAPDKHASDKALVIVSLLFSVVPLLGELVLFISKGTLSPTAPAALVLAFLLLGNLAALRVHGRPRISSVFLSVTLIAVVSVAIHADGGVQSPLWFFQLLAIFGTGLLLGKRGALACGLYTVGLIGVYRFGVETMTTELAQSMTSVVASTSIFTALSFLHERKKELVQAQNRELVRVNEELLEFAYRTSHDLRSPLIRVKELAKFIGEDLNGGNVAEAQRNAKTIQHEADALQGLLRAIFALVKASQETMTPTSVDLRHVIEDVRERLDSSATARGVRIEVDLQHRAEVVLPQERIVQILQHLISNAIVYCDDAKPERYVRVSSSDFASGVRIVVEDNGLGVPDEYAKRLFKMFERFHPKTAAGSGLGLYLVKRHVDKVGADIAYERTAEGSRFVLLIMASNP